MNVGKVYKHTIDKIIKTTNLIQPFDKRLKEMIKLSRRTNLNLRSNKEKCVFFKNVHNILNNKQFESKINQNIIKNYLPYAMTNEHNRIKEKNKFKNNNNNTNVNKFPKKEFDSENDDQEKLILNLKRKSHRKKKWSN